MTKEELANEIIETTFPTAEYNSAVFENLKQSLLRQHTHRELDCLLHDIKKDLGSA